MHLQVLSDMMKNNAPDTDQGIECVFSAHADAEGGARAEEAIPLESAADK